MKNRIILNITTLSAILLFTACSNSQKQLKPESPSKSISIYNIMGITPANSYISENIEPVAKQKNLVGFYPQRTYPQKNYQVNTYSQNVYQERRPTDITFISYKQNNYPNYHKLQQIQNIERRAKSFLGVPYVWGATGPNKFDCSGFTQWVYRDSGINIPRVSREQARVGQFVSYDNLQAGDMVFFDTKKKRQGRVTHVGIYLGNHNFIHASSAGKSVVIYNFDEKPYYKDRFLWGRRVLKPDFYYASN